MSLIGTITQQPNERKEYSIDYNRVLDDGDALMAMLPVPNPADPDEVLTDNPQSDPPGLHLTAVPVHETGMCRLWISGGSHGKDYKVTVRVQTDDGECHESELKVRIREV